MGWMLVGWLLRIPAFALGTLLLAPIDTDLFNVVAGLTELLGVICLIYSLYRIIIWCFNRSKSTILLTKYASAVLASCLFVILDVVFSCYFHKVIDLRYDDIIYTAIIAAGFANSTKYDRGYIANVFNGFAVSGILYLPCVVFFIIYVSFHFGASFTGAFAEETVTHTTVILFMGVSTISIIWRLYRRTKIVRHIPSIIHGSAALTLRAFIVVLGLVGAIIGGAALWYGTPWAGWLWNYDAPGNWIYLKWAGGAAFVWLFLTAMLYLTQGLSIALNAITSRRPNLANAPKVHGPADYGTESRADAAAAGRASPVGAHQQKFKA